MCYSDCFMCIYFSLSKLSFLSFPGGWTPLMYASYVGHDTVVNLLLEANVDPNKSSLTGLTPLMVAAGCGNESVCYFLLQVGTKGVGN